MPVNVIMVSGHVFGRRTFEGVLSSQAYLDGEITVPLMLGLPSSQKENTVGISDLAELAREQDLRYLPAHEGNLSGMSELIRDCHPHYLLVVGWSRLVHPEVLTIPHSIHGKSANDTLTAGCIGMHPSPLPIGRGRAPVPWTIIHGLERSALSVFELEAKADTGSIISQYPLSVRPNETAASLFYRFAHLHFKAGYDLAPHLAMRSVIGVRQEESLSTNWERRRPADSQILHEMDTKAIQRLVRAQMGPYPRAFVTIDEINYPVSAMSVEVSDSAGFVNVEEVGPRTIRYGCLDGVLAFRRSSTT